MDGKRSLLPHSTVVTSTHRVIVVGCGGLGSATLYRLAQQLGSGVLGIEQFELGHGRGASQGHSRIIRPAQHEAQYAALAEHPQISVAVGAGHAFEFAALIGQLLAELALGKPPSHPIEAFSLARPALTDPSYAKAFHV